MKDVITGQHIINDGFTAGACVVTMQFQHGNSFLNSWRGIYLYLIIILGIHIKIKNITNCKQNQLSHILKTGYTGRIRCFKNLPILIIVTLKANIFLSDKLTHQYYEI